MALGGSNMTVTAEIVNLILDGVPPAGYKNLTIFMGIWYGLFTTDQQRWQGFPTHIQIEEMRYGLYRTLPDDKRLLQPVLTPSLMHLIFYALRPVLLGSYVRSQYWDPFYYGTKEKIMAHFGRGTPPMPNMMAPIADLDHHQLTDGEKRILNARMLDKMGPVSVQTDEGFRLMLDAARRTSAAGVRLIVVDMPVASWHAASMPQFPDYQRRKMPWIVALKRLPSVEYVNIQNAVDDSEFSDFIHPRPSLTWRWADRAAKIVRAAPK